MSKYSLFGVNIHPETTYDGKNILKVSSKEEIYFDIFECSFNGKKIIVEKINEFENKPLVEFKLNKDGKVLNCQAFLEIGKENNLFLYEKVKKPTKKVEVITEKTNKVVNKKAIKDKKRKIEENDTKLINSMANEAIKLLEEKQKLKEKEKLEEAKRIEKARRIEEERLVKEAKKLLEEKLLKEKIDADTKKMNEQLKIIEEEERIKHEKIRLKEEAKKLEEIKLLEEERKLKEEIIRNTPFYNDDNSYELDIDVKYKNIKITNESTGAEKIFESRGVPRKVFLNKNLLSYHNVINEETNLNFTIDIETEEIVNQKYVEPKNMGGSALVEKNSGNGNGNGNGGPPTETFAISASFITGNAGTGWFTAWRFSTNGGNAVDRSGPLVPSDNYGSNRTLNFNMGDTIRFENLGINQFEPREEGRPFTIRNVSGVGTSDLAEGVINNSATFGPIFFTPVATGTYYYNDSSDSSGGNGRNFGEIIIS